ncbi:MAG: pantoate--beta-alanine ligase [Thermoleophilia bacterium]|nr:pantoate--beta-alanine ligase [Thermoleophilia bacterium]
MKIIRTKRELRAELRPARGDGRSIGLVPTMGYLHDGHISLLTAARERCDVVVMSLFVNPTQFQSGEDLRDYPRDEEHDARAASLAGVDLLYVPAAEEIYPDGYATSVIVEDLTEVLCGDRSRRGLEHFRGVTTVVAKLFNTSQPDLAFFGQKDAQQAIVVGRMIADLDFPIELVVLPTVREPDGLAMSTRNAYLSPDERRRAPAINASLQAIRARAEQDQPDLASALDAGRSILTEAGIEPEYLEARDAGDLRPIECFNGRPVLIAIAARLGPARLIDNVVIEPSATKRAETRRLINDE